MDLLMRLCESIMEDAEQRPGMTDARIIYLGDYVDRGDASAAVLQHLWDLTRAQPQHHICLKGNHEAMMLDFLDNPREKGARWIRYGGLQTLASYRIGGITERSSVEDIAHASRALRDALPEGLIEWMQNLPTQYQSGNLVCVHAALDPKLPLEEQSEKTRLWGHKEFLKTARPDGLWVAYGHTITETPGLIDTRCLALDTGAYATGWLTAAGLEGSDVWLLST